jgi:hypothetical protein
MEVTKYIKLEDVLKFCPENNDVTGYKPSQLRKKILRLPTVMLKGEEKSE